jgi:SAM-dependent methyltransferase
MLAPIYHLSYSLRRYYVDIFFKENISTLHPNSKVLDLGGHKRNKRGNFNIDEYDFDTLIYINTSADKSPDVIADANLIPIKDNYFDAVICAELLEHVPDPRVVLLEVFRILDDSGILIITAPFLYRVHGDPSDYGRYTEHYWLKYLRNSGFTNIEIEKQGSFFSVLLDFIKQYFNEMRFKPTRALYQVICAIMQKWFLRIEQREKYKNKFFIESFTTGYGIVAQKDSSP